LLGDAKERSKEAEYAVDLAETLNFLGDHLLPKERREDGEDGLTTPLP
jgi:hypothetical protein